MAVPSNNPLQQVQDSILARIYRGEALLDGALKYSGVTTDNVAKELFLNNASTVGLTINSVPEITENSRLYVPPSTVVSLDLTVLGLRTDLAARAVHHHSRWYASVFRPTTGNMVTSGTNAIIDYIDASTPYSAGNPAQHLIVGTAGHSVLAINTAGYFTVTVTGATSQVIKWVVIVDRIRSLGE